MEGQPDPSDALQPHRSPNHDTPADAAAHAGPETPESAAQHSPIRPSHPDAKAAPRPRLVPAKPGTGPLDKAGEKPPSTTETVELSPQEALERLRRQLALAASEFAEGRLNRAQFYAIYTHYNDQRVITERLLRRDPGTDSWQQVVRPGHTSFLRAHFEARILSYAIYDLGQTEPIIRHGSPEPKSQDLLPILRALPDFMRRKGKALGPGRKKVSSGHWLVVLPGQYTVAVVLFSLEPSAGQVMQVADLAHDFERANIHALARGDRAPNRLVFPQRALFETKSLE